MFRYFIEYNEKLNTDVNIAVETRPSIPSPIMEYEEVEVPGRDGLLYIERGYINIEIVISFNFISKDPDEWTNDYRQIKKWLLGHGNRKLKLSDDTDVYYKVEKVEIETPERIIRRCGKFNVIFTCEPFTYLEEGALEVQLSNYMYNENSISKPRYVISGEGLLTINVNGKTVKANVGQQLIIDTELGLCYRSDGSINNIALNGAYEDLYLQEGENTFEWTSGFNINIVPNWRCL